MTELRQTLRRLLHAPGLTLASVLTLAIGIGATTAIFSVVNGILIQPLPYPESDRLVSLRHRLEVTGAEWLPASPAIYFTYRDHSEAFESVALWQAGTASITGAGDPEEARVLRSTHEFLPTLSVQPALGRGFSAAEDIPGAAPTVILSHAYWQRRFGGAQSALGRALNVDGAPHTIVGIMAEDFRFLDERAALLVPLQPDPALAFVGPFGENGIARLKDGVTLAEASADVERMIPIMIETFPLVPGATAEQAAITRTLAPNLEYLKQTVVGDLDDVLWLLLGTIGMLLAIACANVANLRLIHAEGRMHELAIQTALGASWRRITGSLLLESVVLGLVGGAVGLALAALALPVLLAVAAEDLPGVLDVSIDSTVLAFAVAVSLVASLLLGLVPAIKCTLPRAATALAGSGRTLFATRERHRARNALVVAQVALALILLVASGLMIRTLHSMSRIDPGFAAPEAVQVVNISIPRATVPDFGVAGRMLNDIQERIGDIAGVESVGFASSLPLTGQGPRTGFLSFEDHSTAAGQREFRIVSPEYFETLGTPLVAGRTFEWSDFDDDALVALVSENLARAEWGTEAAALGKRLRMTEADPWREIVGVVGDIRQRQLTAPPPQSFYVSLRDPLALFLARTVSFVVRSERTGTVGFIEDLQAAIWSVNADLPLASLQSLGDIHDRALARTALTLVLLSITGAMALLLGLVGIYGVISYTVSQRTREIGIRMALGAQSAALKRLFVTHVLALVTVGAALGLGGAAGLTQLMESLLYGVSALDPATYAAVSILLVATAALAGYVPARRATRVDPMQALRAE